MEGRWKGRRRSLGVKGEVGRRDRKKKTKKK